MRHGCAQLDNACNVTASLGFCMSRNNWQLAMSWIKADLDVQGCSLITFSAFQVSRWLHASSAAAISILLCLVLKDHPHLLPACCTFMAVCMLMLCDRLSRLKEELEGLHLAQCAQIEKLFQVQVCPLASCNLCQSFLCISSDFT